MYEESLAGTSPFLSEKQDTKQNTFRRGTKLLDDRFVISESLGEGSFGQIYLAKDTAANSDVALKIVETTPDQSQTTKTALLNELQLLRRIDSKDHVLRLYDLHVTQENSSTLFLLSMEYAQAGNLRKWLTKHSLDRKKCLSEGLSLFLQICAGVKSIHDANLVHLDIKPENILLFKGENGDIQAKVSDLGLALDLNRLDKFSTMNSIEGRGTPAYMSPEQFTGSDISPASDIYSLGILLHEIVYGTRPFSGNYHEQKEKRLMMIPEKIQDSSESAYFWAIIERCLYRDPNMRYSSIDNFLTRLRCAQDESLLVDVSCPICGHLNEDNTVLFCEKCDTVIAFFFRSCPDCAFDIRTDIPECPKCGRDISHYYRIVRQVHNISIIKEEDPIHVLNLADKLLEEDAVDYREVIREHQEELTQKQSSIRPLITEASLALSAGRLQA